MAGDDQKPSTLKKIVKTIFLVIVWITIGLCLEITGPTLKDLKLKEHAGYEAVSRAISGRSIGFFVGAVIGGFLVDKLEPFCDAIIAICIDGMAGCIIAAPYSPDVSFLWFLLFAAGTFEGVINIAGQKLILNIWLEKASSPMHALHLGFGIGSFIVPQIASPFLAVLAPADSLDNSTWTSNTSMSSTEALFTTQSVLTSTSQEYIKDSRIEWAYLTVGLISVCVSFVFYGYQIFGTPDLSPQDEVSENEISDTKEKEAKETEETKLHSTWWLKVRNTIKLLDPDTCAIGERLYGAQIFMLLFFHFFMAVGAERVYGKFIRSYAIDKLNFSGESGTLINTAFWISFSLGRFAGFVTARWVPIRILIIIEAAGVLVTSILLNIFARDNSLALWILTQPMAFFIAPLFPSGVAWANYHLRMTGMAITFLLFGGGIGGMCHMWIIGYFYDHVSHDAFLYHSVGIGCALVLFVFLLTVRSWGKGNRFKDIKSSVENEVYESKM